MNKKQHKAFINFVVSILQSDTVIPMPSTAKKIKDSFYEFFEQPILNSRITRKKLSEIINDYLDLSNVLIPLMVKYEASKIDEWDSIELRNETLETMRGFHREITEALKRCEMKIKKIEEES